MDADEKGYIVLETIGAFIPFLLLVISILSLVNVVAVQARVHYALTQAANTLSMYCYTLEVTGVANDLTTLDNKAYIVASTASKARSDVLGTLTELNSVLDTGDLNPALQLLLNYGLNELRSKVFEEIAQPLVGRYLSNGSMTGDEYLIRAGVVNHSGKKTGLDALDFYQLDSYGVGNAALIDRNGNVVLTVKYEIEYTFGGLKLPFEPTLRITQTVITKAWLNGSGKGYW